MQYNNQPCIPKSSELKGTQNHEYIELAEDYLVMSRLRRYLSPYVKDRKEGRSRKLTACLLNEVMQLETAKQTQV